MNLLLKTVCIAVICLVLSGCRSANVKIDQIPATEVPAIVMETFHRLHATEEFIETEKHLVNEELIYYIVFRRKDGSLRAMAIKPNGKIVGEYEVVEQ